jgi:hypothetical protein
MVESPNEYIVTVPFEILKHMVTIEQQQKETPILLSTMKGLPSQG